MRRRIISSFVSFALSISALTAISVITAAPAQALTTGSGSGLFALFKNEAVSYSTLPTDIKFSERCGSAIITTLDFNWNSSNMPTGSSCGTLSSGVYENFKTMMTGYILAPITGTVTFKVRSDDGFYMNVNGTNVLSTWAFHGAAPVGSYDATGTMSMVEGNIYPVKVFFSNSAAGTELHLYWNIGSGDVIIPQSNLGLTSSDLGTGCAVGESQYCPADNARQIKAINGTNTNGKYWINVGGTSTLTYALMDSNIDGGAWMLAMKGLTNSQGNSTVLNYDATQWTTTALLQSGSDKNAPLRTNQGQTCSSGYGVTCATGDDANAKNDVFNYSAATEALVVWPDLINRTDGFRYTGAGTYGFTWKESLTSSTGWSNTAAGGVNSSGGCPNTAVTLLVLFSNANRCKLRAASSSSPYDARGATVFSSQNQIDFYGFNYYGSGATPYKKVRFGFGWNENQPGDEGSGDVNGGIGMGGTTGAYGAGDYIGCCQSTNGINRQAGFEFYVRNSSLGVTGTSSSVTAVSGTASTPWTASSPGYSAGASLQRYIVKPIGSGVNMSNISINATTGAVSVAAGISGGTYNLAVSLIDTYGQVASTKFTLTVADAALSSLTLSSGSLNPVFASTTTAYAVSIAYNVTSITVTPTAIKSNATYKTNVNSAGLSSSINSGTTSGSLALNYGANTILIVVTDVNGTTTKTYTITATRDGPPDAPTSLSASAGNGQATITFTPGAINGNAITNYSYSLDGSTYTPFSPAVTSSPVVVSGLTNGTPYTIYLKATNIAGNSAASSGVSVTPKTVPESPSSVTASSNANTQSVLSWTAPANGGSAITNYYVKYSSDGSTWSTPVLTGSTANSYTVTGLSNGASYVFQVAAVNVVGTGNYSSSSASAIPATKPGAPTIGTPTAATSTSISVAFTAPVSNGGNAITGYTVTSSPGGFTGTGTSSPITVSGLTAGTSYTFTVTATNNAGTSDPSSASASTVSAVAPGAPTIGTPTIASVTSVTVPFTAPTDNGGSVITSYTVTSSPGGFTATGSTSPLTVTGLTTGTTYTFTVTATNSKGTSSASSTSVSVTPNAVPSTPDLDSASDTGYSSTDNITNDTTPTFSGTATPGSTIQLKLADVNTGSPCTTDAQGAWSCTAGTVSYSNSAVFKVTSTFDSVNYTTSSTLTITVWPTGTTVSISRSDSGSATLGPNQTANLSFATGRSIYEFTIDDLTVTGGTVSSFTIVNNRQFTAVFTPTADASGTASISISANKTLDYAGNNNGASTALSIAYNTLVYSPDAPTIGTPTIASATSVTVPFSAPASNGGSAITSYTVTSSPGGFTASGLTTSLTVTGLTAGTAYTFTVTATNAKGTSSASSASASITPNVVPGAPTIGTPTIASATSVSVPFTAPADNGGTAVTGYTVTSSPGGFTATGSSSPLTVTGLTAGTAYTFTVTATNAKGTSSASSASASITPNVVPGAPTIGTPTIASATSVSVPFTAPADNGGTAVTGYTVTSSPGGFTGTGTSSPIVVSGLTAGSAYTFTVTATNTKGTSSASSASASITPNVVPGAPTIGAVTVTGTSTVTVGFTAPAGNGGTAITSYTATSNPGGITGSGSTSPITVSGLNPNTAYTFTVTATNTSGTSSPSAASSSVTIAPATITGVTTSNTGTAGPGTVVTVKVTFSKAVSVNLYPSLTLATGTTNRKATYTVAGSTSTVLNFTYTVQTGDSSSDLDYLSTSALALEGGSIRDANGVDATLTLASPGAAGSLAANAALVIDGVAPTVTSVSSSSADGTYKAGSSAIPITVAFSEAVTVTGGTPTLTLAIGSGLAINYSGGSGTSTLIFNYSPAVGDSASDLDYKAVGSLLVGLSSIKDSAGNTAVTTLPAPGASGSLGANKNIVIDGVAPTITNVTSSLADGSYKAGQVIPINVVFSEAVTVTGGTPTIGIVTNTGTSYVSNISYSTGSGTNTLTFNYTVQAGDVSADLRYNATTSFSGGASTIADIAGNNANTTLAAVSAAGSLGYNKNIVVDTTTPTLNSVSSSLASGSYTTGQVIPITVSFSESVVVSGTPTISLEITNNSVQSSTLVASYVSGSGSTSLIFNYTVQAGDSASDLDYVTTTALQLNGGSIADAAGNTTFFYLPSPGASGSLGNNKNIVIDTTAPTISTVRATSSRYGVGSNVDITITFSKSVNVSGSGLPQLLLETGTINRYAVYRSGSGTSQLVFRYTVQDGDSASDLNYVDTLSLELNTGTIKDVAGNNATLTLPDLASSNSIAGAVGSVVIDTIAPTVVSVTSTTANGTYKAGSSISIQILFSESVNVGTPSTQLKLSLETGSPDQDASYSSGTNSTTLTFYYTVQAGDSSADLDYLSASAIIVGTSYIRDNAGNGAVLTLPDPGSLGSLGANSDIVIDTTVPATPTNLVLSAASDTGSSNSDRITSLTSLTFTGIADVGSTVQLKAGASNTGSTCVTAVTGVFTCTTGTLSSGVQTISAFATNAAGTASLSSSTVSVTIDTTAPTKSASSVWTTGATIAITYNEDLSTTSAATSQFTVTAAGSAITVTSVTVTSTTITLALEKRITSGQSVTVAYTDPTTGNDANAVQDIAGNDAATYLATSITNSSTIAVPTFNAPATIASATAMTAYTLVITSATGGSGNGTFSYAVTGGLASLTTYGLTFDTSNTNALKITGTPTAAGKVVGVILTATDSLGVTKSTASFDITINSGNQLPISIATVYGTGGQSLNLISRGGSGNGSISYVARNGTATSCTVSGSTLTATTAAGVSGICYVIATKAADTVYKVSSSLETTIFFTAYVPVVTQTFTCPAGTVPSNPTGIGVGSCMQVLAPVSASSGDAAAAPKITSLSSVTGLVGASIVITGTGFSTVTKVQFGAKSTTTFTATSTSITVNVPTGATTGRVMAFSPTGTAMASQIFTVLVPDTTPPGFLVAAVNTSTPTQILISYNETLASSGIGASAFTVQVAGVTRTVSSVSISSSTVTLTLSSAVTAGQTVNFTYTSPGDTTSIQDAAGNLAASLTSTSVSGI